MVEVLKVRNVELAPEKKAAEVRKVEAGKANPHNQIPLKKIRKRRWKISEIFTMILILN
jgi:hypothetical protein